MREGCKECYFVDRDECDCVTEGCPLEDIETTVTFNGKEYPYEILEKAFAAAKTDKRLNEAIEKLKIEFTERWCTYFLCESRQKEGK